MLFQRRRQNKVFGLLFSKSKWGLGQRPIKLAFRRFFGGSQGTFHQGKKGSLKNIFLIIIGKFSTEICGFESENMWTTNVPTNKMWITWTTHTLIQPYPQGFPKPFFLDFQAENRFSTNPQGLLRLLLINFYLSYLYM